MDIQTFKAERERLRAFCMQGTNLIVIRDLAGRGRFPDPRHSPSVQLAEWLLFVMTVEAERFANPEDDCTDAPSCFVMPDRPITRREVLATLDACQGSMPFIVDYRMGDAMWPMIAPHLVPNALRQIRVWDRGLRQRRRVGGLVTFATAADDVAIVFDGKSLLRRGNGQTLDLGQFWNASMSEIETQPCVHRDQWRRRAFDTQGNA